MAEKLNRRWIGIDNSDLAINTIQKRLLGLQSRIGNKGDFIKPKAFALYHIGVQDDLNKIDYKITPSIG